MADQTKTVGVVKVLSIQGQQATVQVERTFEEVSRGHLVRPWTPQEKRIAPRANTADVKGVIDPADDLPVLLVADGNELLPLGAAELLQQSGPLPVEAEERLADFSRELGLEVAGDTVRRGRKGFRPVEGADLREVHDPSACHLPHDRACDGGPC